MKPGLGDCIDRLSILARKLEELHGQEGWARVKAWQEEEKDLMDYLREQEHPEIPDLGESPAALAAALHLAAVNAMIWEEINRTAADSNRTAGWSYALNRRRADLIAELNGTEELEKL